MNVLTLPEVATLTGKGGFSIGHPMSQGEEARIKFQEHIMRFQMAQEKYFESIVTDFPNDLDTLLLCDRGVLDSLAYLEADSRPVLLERNKWTMNQLSYSRYNGIIHLVTAADGAETYYTTSNNKVRRESPNEAKELDQKIQEAWAGHQDHLIIGNHFNGGFQEKMEETIKALSRLVGLPNAAYILKKCLIDPGFNPADIPSDCIKRNYTIFTDYLESDDPSEDVYLTKRVK